MAAAWRTAAASQGIYTGEIPDGFPVDFVPPHPDGSIDRSALQEGEATLLQKVPGTVDEVYAHYKGFYQGLGWSAADPITVAGRTMAGFSGDGAQVDITLIDQEDGTTFVALALH